jgi:hypothetical protein
MSVHLSSLHVELLGFELADFHEILFLNFSENMRVNLIFIQIWQEKGLYDMNINTLFYHISLSSL